MNYLWTELIVYNFIMSGISLALTISIWWSRRPGRMLLAVVLLIGLSVFVAALVGRVPFESLHLLCFGWFLHVPWITAVGAISLWRNHRRWSVAAGLFSIGLLAIAVDAFWIEPEWLEVTNHEIVSAKVSRPWRVVLIADLQTDQVSDYERRVFEKVRAAQPDLILLAGDYLQTRTDEFPVLRAELNRYLKSIDFGAPDGIYAVGGNSDLTDWRTIFEGIPIHSFMQTGGHDVGELHITGLSVLDSFDPRFRLPENQRFHIALGHGPDFALGQVEADLLLAGHTHGGQVRLPLIGPLITLSRVPRSWASGATQLDERRTLFVSRGVGMERLGAPRLRFLCRPQLVVIDIQPNESGRLSQTARRPVEVRSRR